MDIRFELASIFQMKLNRTLILLFAIVGMLPPVIFRLIRWYNGDTLSNWLIFSGGVLRSIITTVIVSTAVVQVMIWLHHNYPWHKGIGKRLFLELFLTLITACSLVVILSLITQLISHDRELQSAIFNSLIVAVILNFVLVAITEGIFFFKQWKESTIQAERFKNESIRAQLESLKSQVNPHFLFNSLNTLSGLIDHDKELSKEFVDDLSIVYRYVLQHKDEEIVSIKTELDFIKAYTQLLQKRHGNRIAFHFNVDQEIGRHCIPPMTLQLLIENAAKHNISSKKRPLIIEVFNINDYLIVRNNLQKKKFVESSGIGLQNIKDRYKYLTEKRIHITEQSKYFEVKIPILFMKDEN